MNPPKTGLTGLMKALRDEEVQKGLGILIELLKAIGRSAEEISEYQEETK